jgi:hypothetical protein
MAYLPTKARSELVCPRKPGGETALASTLRPNDASPASMSPALRRDRASTCGATSPACMTAGDGVEDGDGFDPPHAAAATHAATALRWVKIGTLMCFLGWGMKDA